MVVRHAIPVRARVPTQPATGGVDRKPAAPLDRASEMTSGGTGSLATTPDPSSEEAGAEMALDACGARGDRLGRPRC